MIQCNFFRQNLVRANSYMCTFCLLDCKHTKVIFYKLPFYRLKRDLYHRALLFTQTKPIMAAKPSAKAHIYAHSWHQYKIVRVNLRTTLAQYSNRDTLDKKIRHLEMIERAITRNGIYRFGIKSLTMYFLLSIISIYEDYTQDISSECSPYCRYSSQTCSMPLPAATALAILPL